MTARKNLKVQPPLNNGGALPIHPYQAFQQFELDSVHQSTAIQEHIGWTYGAILTGLSYRFMGDCWRGVIKAEFKDGSMCAIIEVKRLYRLAEVIKEYASLGKFDWFPDKHPISPDLRRLLTVTGSSLSPVS